MVSDLLCSPDWPQTLSSCLSLLSIMRVSPMPSSGEPALRKLVLLSISLAFVGPYFYITFLIHPVRYITGRTICETVSKVRNLKLAFQPSFFLLLYIMTLSLLFQIFLPHLKNETVNRVCLLSSKFRRFLKPQKVDPSQGSLSTLHVSSRMVALPVFPVVRKWNAPTYGWQSSLAQGSSSSSGYLPPMVYCFSRETVQVRTMLFPGTNHLLTVFLVSAKMIQASKKEQWLALLPHW